MGKPNRIYQSPEKVARLQNKIRNLQKVKGYNISQIMFTYGIADKEWLEDVMIEIENEDEQ